MLADLLLANGSDTWTYQVLHALQDLPTSQQLLDAIRSRQTINQRQFELTRREHIIGGWRDLDILLLGLMLRADPLKLRSIAVSSTISL